MSTHTYTQTKDITKNNQVYCLKANTFWSNHRPGRWCFWIVRPKASVPKGRPFITTLPYVPLQLLPNHWINFIAPRLTVLFPCKYKNIGCFRWAVCVSVYVCVGLKVVQLLPSDKGWLFCFFYDFCCFNWILTFASVLLRLLSSPSKKQTIKKEGILHSKHWKSKLPYC